MGITLRLAAGMRGQQAKGTKIKGRCRKHLKKPSGRPITPSPNQEEEEATPMSEMLSIWAIVRAFGS